MSGDHSLQDTIWLVTCAALVMLMQGGFCLLESGLVRAKNSINVAIKNLVDFCVCGAIFWSIGFAVMFGFSREGLLGTSGFFLGSSTDSWLLAFFLFQFMFCATATTIISGAAAERIRFAGYITVAIIVAAFIYPVFGHWAWARTADGEPAGWLLRLGFVDFAGSSVVHGVAGWVALAVLLIVGPRIGRFGPGSKPITGDNIPMATVGVLLLWFGWFGYNGGSTLAFDEGIPMILVNTNLAAVFGALAALALTWTLDGRPDVKQVMNGAIGGLVGISASCHVVGPVSAAAIGTVSGAICFVATHLLVRMKIDDVNGSVPAHGCAGVWGVLAVALFGDPQAWGTGLGRAEQLMVQAFGAIVCFAWAFGLGFTLLWLVNRWLPLRISAQGEKIGLNMAEHGASTAMLDLLGEMDHQVRTGDFSTKVAVEPHTEVGQIASRYNRVLNRVNTEARKREEAVEKLTHREEQLRDEVLRDDLTGLPNRTLIMDRIRGAIERTKRLADYRFAVLFLDFDRFKIINDSLGHEAGDKLLVMIGERLQTHLRSGDSVTHVDNHTSARLGGDEFLLLLDGIHDIRDAVYVAERVQETLSEPYDLDGQEVNSSASIGIVFSDGQYDRPEDIVRDADIAMCQAKGTGKARHIVFDQSMHQDLIERLHLEKELRWAVDREEFTLMYQPIICLESGSPTGFEALIRWHHPQRGVVSPLEFIPIAEETGLIVPIGAWALQEACRQLKAWQQKFDHDPPLAINVNLSKRQLCEPELVATVRQIMRDTGIRPGSLKLEITESMIMDNQQDLTPVLHALREMGIVLCMDDFGTGHSSLSCLHRFPIDVLKIDRAFINTMEHKVDFTAITQAIVMIAHTLKMSVVAEGIETTAQLAQLQAIDCDYGQGYYFAKPLSVEAAEAFICGDRSYSKSA
jgi:Amt family ammonium transporter